MLKKIFVSFLFINLLIFITFVKETKGLCTAEDKYIADRSEMYPPSPICLLENDTLAIYCSVDNSQNITKNKLSIYDGEKRMDTKIINGTTISYTIDSVKMMRKQYTCKFGDCGIKVIEVFVGFAPLEVYDFKCRSKNWQDLNCTFRQQENPIRTEYILNYYADTVGGRQTVDDTKEITNAMNFKCGSLNNIHKYKTIAEATCQLNQTNNNGHFCYLNTKAYRQVYDYYTFELSMGNVFDKRTQTFVINNFASMIPDPIQDLKYHNVTSDSAIVTWKIPYQLEMWPAGFEWDIQLLSNLCTIKTSKIQMNKLTIKKLIYTLPITLEYAHTWYEVKIRYRSKKANDTDEMYSEYKHIIFQTLSRIPDDPPKIDMGGFHYKDNNDLIIYWKELDKCHQNGNFSTYEITPPGKIKTNNWTKYENIKLVQKKKISIKSMNSMGTSIQDSQIIIPDYKSLLPQPQHLQKFSKSGIYKITWNKPDLAYMSKDITHYTIFWCDSKDQQADECASSINFTHVNKTTLEFNYPSNNTKLNFAIAANSNDSSSGMLWAMCTISENKEIDSKLKTVWFKGYEPRSITIQWKLDCIDESLVEGFNIIYCPFVGIMPENCSETENIVNTTKRDGYTLTNLRPNTSYKIVISMFSKTKMGPPSTPIVNTTAEDAPTPPFNLTSLYVNSSAIQLKWNDPHYWNGNQQNYIIKYNDKIQDINYDIINGTSTTILKHLNGSTDYIIDIKACTKYCSVSSDNITVRTEIGKPNKVPELRLSGGLSKPYVKWERPLIPSGNIDYYEMKIIIYENGINKTTISKIRTACTLHKSLCNEDTEKYEIFVRAVNINRKINQTQPELINYENVCSEEDELIQFLKHNLYYEHLKGAWSKSEERPCENKVYGNFYLNIAMICIAFLIMLYVTVIALKKFRKMKDIGIELPAGLEDISKDSKPKTSDNNLNKLDKKKDDDFISEQEKKKLITSVHNNSTSSLENNSQCGSSDFYEQDDSEQINNESNNDHCSSVIHQDDTIDNLENMEKKDPIKSFILDDNKMVPTEVQLIKPQPPTTNIFPQNFQVMSNGYVQAPSFSAPNANGYVQQQMLPRIISDGYTPLSAITAVNKNLMNTPRSDLNSYPSNVKTTADHAISGYVTHKQLSDFGHSRMQ